MKVAQIAHEDDGKKVAIVLEAESDAEKVILGLLQYRNGFSGPMASDDHSKLTLTMTVRNS